MEVLALMLQNVPNEEAARHIVLAFLAILVVGYVYAWRRGALQWA